MDTTHLKRDTLSGHLYRCPNGHLSHSACCKCTSCSDAGYADLTPDINSNNIQWFNGGADFEPGCYRIRYLTGDMRLTNDSGSGFFPWDACIAAAIWNGTTETAGPAPAAGGNAGYIHQTACCSGFFANPANTEADVIAARQALAEGICFCHHGGKIGVYCADPELGDNVHSVAFTDPTYRLQTCSG